jgi:hypothetical protein
MQCGAPEASEVGVLLPQVMGFIWVYGEYMGKIIYHNISIVSIIINHNNIIIYHNNIIIYHNISIVRWAYEPIYDFITM